MLRKLPLVTPQICKPLTWQSPDVCAAIAALSEFLAAVEFGLGDANFKPQAVPAAPRSEKQPPNPKPHMNKKFGTKVTF